MSVFPEQKPLSKKQDFLNGMKDSNRIEFPQEFYDALIVLSKPQLIGKILLLTAKIQELLNNIDDQTKITETGIKQ
jgi:hypothetical protein